MRENDSRFDSIPVGEREVLDEKVFGRMLMIERKRTERSKQPFILMLLDAGKRPHLTSKNHALASMARSFLGYCRDTDVVGWYKTGSAIGVIFTGLDVKDPSSAYGIFMNRVRSLLQEDPALRQLNQISISFHLFPDDWDSTEPGAPNNTILYPDLKEEEQRKRPMLVVKRAIDIVGSSLALLVASPLMLVIAIAIKLTSKGDVLFRQQRVGQYGKCFTFLKFRSMYTGNNNQVHQSFVTQLIANQASGKAGSKEPVYKIQNDSRITAIGRFLRKTSLDELPQFWNVLRGEMSLVGPRPPIPYELAAYQTWHRRRVLESKPGITGLWQILGRSRVRFDDMVRMDLQYSATWTPWLDIKILLRTPLAVIRGAGAM